MCFEKSTIAKTFNDFVHYHSCKLVDKLPNSVGKYGEYFVISFYSKLGVRSNLAFPSVPDAKVLKYNSLSPNKATGLDGLPSRFIRDGAPLIVGPLRHIINLSLIQGKVSDELKNVRVVPLF